MNLDDIIANEYSSKAAQQRREREARPQADIPRAQATENRKAKRAKRKQKASEQARSEPRIETRQETLEVLHELLDSNPGGHEVLDDGSIVINGLRIVSANNGRL